MDRLYTPDFGYLTDEEDIRIYKRKQQEKEYYDMYQKSMEEEYYRQMEEEYHKEYDAMYQEYLDLHEYLKDEWWKYIHTKYHRYFEEWFSNLTDDQLTFFMSWKNGQISPYCEKINN